MPFIDDEVWIANLMDSGVDRDLARQLLSLAAVRGTQMRNRAELSGDPLVDPVINLGDDLFLVITSVAARRDGERRESFHVQVLDTASSPAVLHDPDVVHDGTRAGAVLAGEDWSQRLRTVEGV